MASKRIERADRRGAGACDDRDNGMAKRTASSKFSVEEDRVHSAPLVQPDGDDLSAAETQDAGSPGDAVVGVGMCQ